jgi:hypothetical protein
MRRLITRRRSSKPSSRQIVLEDVAVLRDDNTVAYVVRA